MPRLVITTQPTGDERPTVIYQERIVVDELADDTHYGSQLLERVGWGVADAAEAEAQQRRSPGRAA